MAPLRIASFAFAAVLLSSCWGAPEGTPGTCQGELELPPSVSTDILFVIDNSRSMKEEQEKVAAQLQAFVGSLARGPVPNDFQIGVVTTGVTQQYASSCATGAQVVTEVFSRESGRLQLGGLAPGEPRILSSGSMGEDPAGWLEKVRQLLAQGISGSGQEMGLEAARLALSEPLLSLSPFANPSGNAGFLRSGSRLLVVVVSDEDDCSVPAAETLTLLPPCGSPCKADSECGGLGHYCTPEDPTDPRSPRRCTENVCETPEGRDRLIPVADYVGFLQSMEDGFGRRREVFLAVIGAVDELGDPSRCQRGGDEAYGVASRYREAVKGMGERGLIASICSADYGASLQRIADLVSAPHTLALPEPPADPRLLMVEVTRADGTVERCWQGEGFDYSAPQPGGPAWVTMRGDCRLRAGDRVAFKLICAR